MKILNLKAQGFRSLKSIDWSPGDLNLLIGPNAGGKSNLLQLLNMLCISAQGKLANFIKNQGGMQSLVWNGEAKKISVELDTIAQMKNNSKIPLVYLLDIDRVEKTNSYKTIECLAENKKSYPALLRRDDLGNIEIYDNNNNNLFLHDMGKNISEYETLLSITEKSFLGSDATRIYHEQMTSWKMFSLFDVGPQSKVRQPVIASYETEMDSEGENFVGFLHTLYEENVDFRDEINSAMKAAFPHFKELTFSPGGGDGRIQFGIRWEGMKRPHFAYVLSDGTLRFLYLITILAHPVPPAMIAIDEPEMGLHPAMLPIIAEYAVQASKRTQVILSTHSPEMLSAFGDHQKDVTVTVAEWKDGQTQLRILDGVKLDYWLKDYALGELFRSGELEGM